MSKKLVIDLNQCDECEKCAVKCAYHYQPQPASEHGILALREEVNFLLVCRRCENPCCAAACRFEALERQPGGFMKRYNLRCVSCKCCAHACPFGTIYPDTVPIYSARCDYCLPLAGGEPACVASCVKNAIEHREVEEGEDLIMLGDHLAVRSRRFSKNDLPLEDEEKTLSCLTLPT